MNFRGLCLALVIGVSALAPAPASAQKMSDDGMQIPWFRSQSERNARAACENDLPECRDSIRKQIAGEKAITRFFPWIFLCLIVLGAMRFVRMREKKREQRRAEAARHHVRASLRETKAKESAADDEDGDDADDGFGIGTPGNRGLRR